MNINEQLISAIKEVLEITEEQVQAVTFIFWLTCLAESLIAKPSAKRWGEIAKNGGYEHGETLIHFMFYEMSLVSKMKVLKKQIELMGMKQEDFKEFLAFLERLNSLRNPIAHYKFEDLKWKGESLENPEVRERVVEEFYAMSQSMPKSDS